MLQQLRRSAVGKSLMGNGYFAVASFATFSILAHHFSPEGLGQWVLYLAGTSFFEMLRQGVLHVPLVTLYNQRPQETKNIIGSTWGVGLMLSGLLVILVLLLIMTGQVPESYTLFAGYFPYLFLCSLPYHLGLNLLQAQNHFGRVAAVKGAMSTLMLLVALAVSATGGGPRAMVWGHIGSTLVVSMWLMVRGWAGVRWLKSCRWADIKEIGKIARYTTLSCMGTQLLKGSDVLIIGALLGAAPVGIYQLATKVIEGLEPVLRSFALPALPKISQFWAEKNKEKAKRYVHQSLGILYLMLTPVLVGLFLGAPLIVQLLAGTGYESAVVIMRILTVFGLLLPLDRYYGIVLDATGHARINTIKIALMVSCNLLGDVLVIRFTDHLGWIAFITGLNMVVGLVVGYRSTRVFFPLRGKVVISHAQQAWHSISQKLTPAKV